MQFPNKYCLNQRHALHIFMGVIALCLNLVFRAFLCSLLRYWLKIWYMNLSWHNTDQVRLSSGLTYFYGSYCPLLKFSFPSVVSWDIGSKFGILICHDIIQIKFHFRHTWPTFMGVIALCLNFVFWAFLCSLLRYWLEIWYINLSWHNTDQVRLTPRLTYFYGSNCPLFKFIFPAFLCSLLRYWLKIWYMNLSWHNTDQVRLSSGLTYFYGSYCPLLKFSFLGFSL